MSEPNVSAVRGVDLAVQDLDQSTQFYCEAWGLLEVARDAGTVYLRATGAEHHVLALHEAPQAAFLGSRLAVADKGAVDALHARARAFGADVIDAPHSLSAAAGGGYGFSFRTPDGLRQSISADVARHAQVIEDRTRPQKFSHVVLRAANHPELEGFFRDLLGFKHSDTTDGITFLRCSPDHHSVALAKAAGPGLHHMAFELPNLDGVMYASGRLRSKGFDVEWGIGRHSGPGNNVFSFFVEPNGFAAEMTTEMEQIDDATYPKRSAQWWRENRPNGSPDAWGLATQRSERLHAARTGRLVAELNKRCEEVISERLAQ